MSQTRSHKKGKRQQPRQRGVGDGAIYAGFIMTGVVIAFLSVPLTNGEYWIEITVGYVLAVAWLVNLYGWRAYMGRGLAGWQQAFARIPLRFAGFGTKGGKPIEAAHGRPPARTALIATTILSVALLAALAILLAPTA